jgi:hypothetical protein
VGTTVQIKSLEFADLAQFCNSKTYKSCMSNDVERAMEKRNTHRVLLGKRLKKRGQLEVLIADWGMILNCILTG